MIWLKNCSLGIKLQSLNLCMERHLWIKISFVSKHSKIQFLFEKNVLLHIFSSPKPYAQISFSYNLSSMNSLQFTQVSFSYHPSSMNSLQFGNFFKNYWVKLDHIWMVLFQNLVGWPCLTFNMAAMASNWLTNKYLLLQNHLMEWNQI